MGGAQAGELASRLAAAALREYRNEVALDPETHLRSSIQEANRRIYARAASDPQVSGMGTTVTAAIVAGDSVAVGHVGDSRGYRIRDGEVEQLTQDHSLVADLVRSGGSPRRRPRSTRSALSSPVRSERTPPSRSTASRSTSGQAMSSCSARTD